MNGKIDTNIQIGKRVKQAREAAGLTQERLSELADVTPQHLSGVERGVVGLSIPILMRLCTILSVSTDYVLLGETPCTDATSVAARLSRLPAEHVKNVEDIIDRYLEGVAIAGQGVSRGE